MSNENIPKRLADCVPTTVSREFEPTGWIGKNGKFNPEVRIRGLHWKAANISVDAALILERSFEAFITAAIEAAKDPAIEATVRADHAKRIAEKAGNPAPSTKIYTEPAPENRVVASPLAAALAARK